MEEDEREAFSKVLAIEERVAEWFKFKWDFFLNRAEQESA